MPVPSRHGSRNSNTREPHERQQDRCELHLVGRTHGVFELRLLKLQWRYVVVWWCGGLAALGVCKGAVFLLSVESRSRCRRGRSTYVCLVSRLSCKRGTFDVCADDYWGEKASMYWLVVKVSEGRRKCRTRSQNKYRSALSERDFSYDEQRQCITV